MLGSTGLTFATWFKSVSSGGWARIFDFGNGNQAGSLCITANQASSGKLGYYTFSVDGSKTVGQPTDLTVNDGVWRHLVWTIETDGSWTMYINGRVYKTDVSKNTKWVFPNSNGVWYSPLTNGYQTKWGTLGIVSNSNMTVSFTLIITQQGTSTNTLTAAAYRNIFHIANTYNEWSRNPSVWIVNTVQGMKLHLASDTTTTSNFNVNTGTISLNEEVNVDLVWSDRTLYVYYNGVLDTQLLLDNTIVAASANADLYIADPWYTSGGFQIKDFKITNGVAVRHMYPASIFRSTAWLGKSQFTQDSPYNGNIDDFRIYNTVLSPTDVSTLYNYSTPTGNTNIIT